MSPTTTTMPPLLELREIPQWVVWKFVNVRKADGTVRPTKKPFNAKAPTMPASSTDPATWATYAEAAAAFKLNGTFNGIGFVVTEADPYCGIDLDHCIDDAGVIEPWAQEIVDRFESYTERTPSGHGLRIWINGHLPVDKHKKTGFGADKEGTVEIYDDERYFTVTGEHLAGTPTTIENRQPQLEELCARLWPAAKAKAKPAAHALNGTVAATRLPAPRAASPAAEPDIKAIADAIESTGDPKLVRLWKGDASGYPSASEADAALCWHLAQITREPARIDALFRRSGLMRDDKWNRRGYRDSTIELALSGSSAQLADAPVIEGPHGIALRVTGPPRRTPTKMIVQVDILRDGAIIGKLSLSSSTTGIREATSHLTALLGAGDDPKQAAAQVRAMIGEALARADLIPERERPAPATDTAGRACEIIGSWLRERHAPTHVVGGGVWSGTESRIVTPRDLDADSALIDLLAGARDAPRDQTGALKRHALPALYRTWLPVAYSDLRRSLPTEPTAGGAAQIRDSVYRLLTSLVSLGAAISEGETRVERRTLAAWAEFMASRDGRAGWRQMRSLSAWYNVGDEAIRLSIAVPLAWQIGVSPPPGWPRSLDALSRALDVAGCGGGPVVVGGRVVAAELSAELVAEALPTAEEAAQ